MLSLGRACELTLDPGAKTTATTSPLASKDNCPDVSLFRDGCNSIPCLLELLIMTERNRSDLKALFETNDVLLENSFTDFIDSNLNLIDTTAQLFNSTISAPGLVAHTVSAVNNYTTNTFGQLARVSAMQSKPPFIELILKRIRTSAASRHSDFLLHGTVDTDIAISANCSALAGNAVGFTFTTAGRITYTGAVTASFVVKYDFSLYIPLSTQKLTLRMYKNGAAIPKARMRFNTISDQHEFVQLRQIVKMATNDFVEPFIQCNTTASVAVHVMGFNAVAFPLHWHY